VDPAPAAKDAATDPARRGAPTPPAAAIAVNPPAAAPPIPQTANSTTGRADTST
jgi:hypothetical protein